MKYVGTTIALSPSIQHRVLTYTNGQLNLNSLNRLKEGKYMAPAKDINQFPAVRGVIDHLHYVIVCSGRLASIHTSIL